MISDDNSLDMFQYCKESAADVIEKFKANNVNSALNLCIQKYPVQPKCLDNSSTIKHFIARHNSG